LDKANLILPRLTFDAMATIVVESGQKSTEMVGVVVVIVVVVFKLLHLAGTCTLTSAFPVVK